jgi:hypothetical protein
MHIIIFLTYRTFLFKLSNKTELREIFYSSEWSGRILKLSTSWVPYIMINV